jgi:hypothetical protein
VTCAILRNRADELDHFLVTQSREFLQQDLVASRCAHSPVRSRDVGLARE